MNNLGIKEEDIYVNFILMLNFSVYSKKFQIKMFGTNSYQLNEEWK